MKLSKKIYIVFIFIINLFCLSACSTQSKDSVELVKHYGQHKVDEMKVKCTDDRQLEIANSLVEKARQIMSFTDSNKETIISNCGALEKYFFNHEDYKEAKSSDVSIELITTKQENEKGYIWVKYSVSYYDKDNQIITGNSDVISRWDIVLKNGKWTVTEIAEIS